MSRNDLDKPSAGQDSRPILESGKYGFFVRSALAAVLTMVCANDADAKSPQYNDLSNKPTGEIIRPTNNSFKSLSSEEYLAQRSQLAQPSFGAPPERGLQTKSILRMSWDDLKAKLEKAHYDEITKITDGLADLARDASKIQPIGDRLKLGYPLNAEHKKSLLELAEKYNIPDIAKFEDILAKEELAEQDREDALDTIEKILVWPEKAAHRYVEIKIWLAGIVPLTGMFDSAEDLEKWMKDTIEKIKKFKEYEKAIKEYRESLNQPLGSAINEYRRFLSRPIGWK